MINKIFRRPRTKTVVYAVNYTDGRTAYMWLDDQQTFVSDYIATPMAHERQQAGELPEGVIANVRRVN